MGTYSGLSSIVPSCAPSSAGGEKYAANGIFIKLTRDFAGIYGGDMGAAKAAKHEIRSLKELIAWCV